MKIRITDIADMAGVSAGTVDRVIHRRGKVSADKAERVEKVLREIGYEPNLAARALASKKEFPIAVIAPSFDGPGYWSKVGEGMAKAVTELRQYNVTVDLFRFDQYDRDSFPVSIPGNGQYKGFVIATLFEGRVKQLSEKLDAAEIPYVYIDSVIEGQRDLAYFGVDAYRSGYIAGKLLSREIAPQDDLLLAHIRFSRTEISLQMEARRQGIKEALREHGHMGLTSELELNPGTPESLRTLTQYLGECEGKVGAVVLNSRIYELAGMLEQYSPELRRRVVAAGFEAIAPNVTALKKGMVDFLISQRPELQGYDALKALGNFLLDGQRPQKVNFMPIDIIIPENVDYYNNYKL